MGDPQDPNFPPRLEINPSENDFGDSEIFGLNSQKSTIQKYGIAGRVWEAAYTLTTYLESEQPWIEFDPPSPLAARRAHRQRRSLSTPLSEHAGSNFSRSENGRPDPSEPRLCPSLDVEDVPKPLTILELGSGTGIVIAKLAEIINQSVNDVLTDDVLIATDLENVCPLLDENLSISTTTERSPGPRILVRPLEWGNLDYSLRISNELGLRNLTHIICSDLVYFPHLLAPLLRSLIHLTSLPTSSPQPTIILSYKIRSLPKEIPFWSAFGLWFSYEPLLYRRYRQSLLASHQGNGNYESDRPLLNTHSNGDLKTEWFRYHTPSSTYVFIAHRRSTSIGWSIPEDDKDLLEGVGAHGDQRRKGDDAFELMMLMSLVDDGD